MDGFPFCHNLNFYFYCNEKTSSSFSFQSWMQMVALTPGLNAWHGSRQKHSRNWNLFRSLWISEIFLCDSAWGHLTVTQNPICISVLLSAVVLLTVAGFEQGELTLVSMTIEKQSQPGALPCASEGTWAEPDHSIINIFRVYSHFSFRKGGIILSVPADRQEPPFPPEQGEGALPANASRRAQRLEHPSAECTGALRDSFWQGFTFH